MGSEDHSKAPAGKNPQTSARPHVRTSALPSSTSALSPRVGVVVLNWHGRYDTLDCLRALRALDYPSFFVILIDNGCEELSAEDLAGLAAESCYLRSPENLGFAGGSNLGMREALKRGADYVWFLNNDALPEAEALRELIAVAEGEARPAIVGAKILSAADPARLDSVALSVDLRFGRILLVGHDEIDRGQYDDLRASAVTGCAMLVSRAAAERLAGFDETFFAYLEDADFCLRALSLGFRVAIAPRSRVLHRRPAATGARQSTLSLYYATRNHLTLLDRHGGGSPLRRRVLRALAATYNIAYALRGGGSTRSERIRAVWRGVRGDPA
jgi:GT2 family glycosyltransferase